MGKVKIAIVISHPIQHFCPQYVSFTKNDDAEIKVFFGSALGYKKYVDENFKQEIHWNNLNLDQFDHLFLNGDKVIQGDKDLDASSLENELDQYRPDILFTYGYFQKLQRRARKWALRKKVQLAYISDSELRHHSNYFKDILKGFFLRRYFSRIDYFLTMGNANEAYYLKYKVPKEKMIRMHYPIDRESYIIDYDQRKPLRKKIRDDFQIPAGEIVLSVVGKLVSWKNQDHLIEALLLLEKEGIYLHLFIIGSGEKKSEWEQKAKTLTKSKVYFPGFVDIKELPAYYAATDIYVHPASLEPHSVAISEAIFMGCPVIISDRCGSYGDEDDVQEGKNGFVYWFGNIRELAQKIKLLATDEAMRKEFGMYSHKIADTFQQRSHVEMLKDLLNKLELEIRR